MYSSSDFEDVGVLYLDEDSVRELESRKLSFDAKTDRWNLLAAAKWLFKAIRNYYTIPPARNRIREQLENRTAFFEGDWRKTGLPLDVVVIVLDCIRSAFDWPNRNFLPDDSLDLLLIPCADEMADLELTMELEERLSIKLTNEDVDRIFRRGRTVEEFVRELSKMTHDTPGDGAERTS